MDRFAACPLTATGTPQMIEGEYLRATAEPVSFLAHDKKPTPYKKGLLSVTTHRLIWTDATRTSAIGIMLMTFPPSPILDKSGPLHPRTLLRIGLGIRLIYESKSGAKDRDRIVEALGAAIAAREWERVAKARAERERQELASGAYVAQRRLGTAGVRDRVAAARNEQRIALDAGLASLDDLRSQAADLVRIAETFRNMSRARLSRDGSSASPGVAMDDELLHLLAEMGMESPITKSATGGNVRMYREQLARQMAGFLQTPLQAVGGVMPMADAYCLVMRNRATTELVSPEDFRAAVELLGKLKLGVRMTRLESGVLAMETDVASDKSGAQALRKLAEERTSVTAIDVMRMRHIPIQRARGMLEEAENLGFLARDETVDGVRFFPNEFVQVMGGV